MQNRLFRKKSLDRVSSPEQLHDYMRVTSPAIWMVLGAVIALLAGLLILASVRPLETTLSVEVRVSGGSLSAAIPDEQAGKVRAGMPLRLAGRETRIETVYQDAAGATVCAATLSVEDGTYDAQIVTDSVAPIRFLLN